MFLQGAEGDGGSHGPCHSYQQDSNRDGKAADATYQNYIYCNANEIERVHFYHRISVIVTVRIYPIIMIEEKRISIG